jgi:hypothetical protein
MSIGKTLILSLLVFGLGLPPDAEAWSLGAGVGRAAMRRILRQDWLRDGGMSAIEVEAREGRISRIVRARRSACE